MHDGALSWGGSLQDVPHLPELKTAWATLGLVAAGLSLIGMGGCASDFTGQRSVGPVQAFSTNALRVIRPRLISRPDGLHVAGAVCRRRQDVVRPQSVRIERVAAGGSIPDVTQVKLGRLDDHPIHCVFYDAQTSWRLGPGEEIRVCLNRVAADGLAAAVCGPAS